MSPLAHGVSHPPAVGVADEAILRAVARYHYLTAEQVRRLFYAKGVITYVRARLKRLAEGGHLQRVPLRRTGPAGGAPYAYRLGPRGRAYLEALGIEVLARYRPSEQPLDYFLEHTLCVNDALMAFELVARSHAQVELVGMRHERVLKRQPVTVELPDGGRQTLIPDGWVALHVADGDGRYQACFALELDRGHVEQKRWRRKVAALVAWWTTGAYTAAFQAHSLTIAVVATPGEGRRIELLRWTAAELSELEQQDQADLFRVTGVAADQVSPAAFVLAPSWYRPFDPAPRPLLEVDGAG